MAVPPRTRIFLRNSTNLGIGTDYETVAENVGPQTLGPKGAVGDILRRLIIIPEDGTPGAVILQDGGDPAFTIFGSGSVGELSPFVVDMNMRSRVGGWAVSTTADVTVIAVGTFT